MVVVRALAVFYPESLEEIQSPEKLVREVRRAEKCLEDSSLKPWTLRIVLPPIEDPESVLESSDASFFRRVGEAITTRTTALLHLVSVENRGDLAAKIFNLIEECSNCYASILCRNRSCLEEAFKRFWIQSGVDVFTRIAVLLRAWVSTPYFPATSNPSRLQGVALAFRYASEVKRLVKGETRFKKLVEELDTIAREAEKASKCLELELLGSDYSLSPWMEESVAEVIEELAGSRIGEIGSYGGIREANKIVWEIAGSASLKPIGFNEAMLAVAEDSLLDKRVEEGIVNLRGLVAYTTLCVAGLDMVALPERLVEPQKLAGDLWAVGEAKNKPIGARVIPVDSEPGERIVLSRFGSTTIIYP